MKTLDDLAPYAALRAQMVATERINGNELTCDFSDDWTRARGWVVVPTEPSGGHLGPEARRRLARVLTAHGITHCVALATEPLGDHPSAYSLEASEPDLTAFDKTLGLFRFIITDEGHTFAISCTEWYNLYAADAPLLEAMLGNSIEKARGEFLRYVGSLTTGSDERLASIAARYARG